MTVKEGLDLGIVQIHFKIASTNIHDLLKFMIVTEIETILWKMQRIFKCHLSNMSE